MRSRLQVFFAPILCILLFAAHSSFAQGTAFTYQGQLNFNGAPANGLYDFQFAAYDSDAGGKQEGTTLAANNLLVSNGVFTVSLDFGNVFPGASRWLGISVRTNRAVSFTALAPRQSITPTPYAITSSSVRPGGVTEGMLASGAVTSDKIAAGAVKGFQLDDAGAGVYRAFQQTIEPVAGASLPFERLAVITATNGVNPVLRLTLSGLAFGTVTGYSAVEEMSRPYSYVIQGTTTGSATDPNTRIGSLARLEFTRNGKTTVFGGVITAFAFSSSDSATRIFTARIEPVLSYLAFTTDYEVFQEKTIPEVVRAIYKLATAIDLPESLARSYSPRGTVIQYGESELNFFSRLLEDEGIFYFFDHAAVSPAPSLGDNTAAYVPGPAASVPYYGNNPSVTIPSGAEYVRTFEKAARQSTIRSTVNSYDMTRPSLSQIRTVSGPNGVGETYEFGPPGNQQLAGVRQARHNVERATLSGSSTLPDLRPGRTFTLDDRTPAGLSGSYVVTAVRHGGFHRLVNGVNSFYYGNEFEAIPASLTFVPPLSSPKPNAQPSTAVVTGPAGETVHVDEYGRVKVKFHWDRHGSSDDRSSAWLRVMTPMAGARHGMMFLPQVGDEVLVSFLQGDPDQPVVTGSLFNDAAVPSYPLPQRKTVSTIRSTSTDNLVNEIRFEDKAGVQELSIQAAKDLLLGARGQVFVGAPLSFGGGTALTRVLAGQANVGTATSSQTTVTITFSPAFTSTPRILLTPNNDPNWNVNDTFVATVRTISTTSCVVNIVRVDASGGWSQALKVNWIAWQ